MSRKTIIKTVVAAVLALSVVGVGVCMLQLPRAAMIAGYVCAAAGAAAGFVFSRIKKND